MVNVKAFPYLILSVGVGADLQSTWHTATQVINTNNLEKVVSEMSRPVVYLSAECCPSI